MRGGKAPSAPSGVFRPYRNRLGGVLFIARVTLNPTAANSKNCQATTHIPEKKRHKKATCHVDEDYPSVKTSPAWFLADPERSLTLRFKGHRYRLAGLNSETSEQFLQKQPG